MVLHNSKWDRRATKKYLKKHGLTQQDLQKEREERKKLKQTQKAKGEVGEEDEVVDSTSELDSNEELQEGPEEDSEPKGFETPDEYEGLDDEEEGSDEEAHHFGEVDLWPAPQDDDNDEEYRDLVLEAARKQHMESGGDSLNATDHITLVEDDQERENFVAIQKEIERAELRKDITRRFGRKKVSAFANLNSNAMGSTVSTGANHDEDDFDAFLDEVDAKLGLQGNSRPAMSEKKSSGATASKPKFSADNWTSVDNFL